MTAIFFSSFAQNTISAIDSGRVSTAPSENNLDGRQPQPWGFFLPETSLLLLVAAAQGLPLACLSLTQSSSHEMSSFTSRCTVSGF